MVRLALMILWLSFLVAIAAEEFFFSFFDPHDLNRGGVHIELAPLGVYTLGLFFFWAFCATASMLSLYMCLV